MILCSYIIDNIYISCCFFIFSNSKWHIPLNFNAYNRIYILNYFTILIEIAEFENRFFAVQVSCSFVKLKCQCHIRFSFKIRVQPSLQSPITIYQFLPHMLSQANIMQTLLSSLLPYRNTQMLSQCQP
jgi:hypothetical protein